MEFSKYFDYPYSLPVPPDLPSVMSIKTEPDAQPPPPPPQTSHPPVMPTIKSEPLFDNQSFAHNSPYYGQPLSWLPPNPNHFNPFKYCSPHPSDLLSHGQYSQHYENWPHGLPQELHNPFRIDPKLSVEVGGKIKSKNSKKSPTKSKKSKGNLKPVKLEDKKLSPRKKIDRFDGHSEEEVARKQLPDHLDHNLDILIIGINPGLYAAHKGHHYAGPGNHFWKCLYMSGIVSEPFTSDDDYKMLDQKIGFTNLVARTTRGSADLSKTEMKEGCEILLSKLRYYQPKIAVFNGKGIYEVFSGKKQFHFGKQPSKIEGTNIHVWVMPSSSARCAQLPRAVDKVPFYVALKKLRDFLNGQLQHVEESEVTFIDLKLKNQKSSPTKLKMEPETNDKH